MKTVHSFNYVTNLYMGPVVLTNADLSPLEDGVYLIPGNCLEAEPPAPGEGQYVIQIEGRWELRDVVDPLPTPEPEPSPEEIAAGFTAAIQMRLDNFARTRNYDGILSACTYATSTVPKFQAEAQTCVNLRDATWAAAYEILAQVQAGQRPMPATIEDIEDDLPALAWTA